MKQILTSALIIATIAVVAQNKDLKKACIKIETEENGLVKKIDTCVTAATKEELDAKLKALNIDLPVPPTPPIPPTGFTPPTPPDVPHISIQIDSLPGDDYSYTYTKVIEIDDGGDSDSKKSNGKRKTKIITKSGGKDGEAYAFVMDDNGNIVQSSGGEDGMVVVKTLKPGEDIGKEIEKLLKEHGIDKEGNCTAKKIIINSGYSKDEKDHKEVQVFVFSDTKVEKISDADKKKLPADASKAINKGRTFDNLNISPNPTDNECTISYKSVSKEPLIIKVYSEEGKTVLSETDNNATAQVNKTISLKDLGKGVYFIHLTQGKLSEVRKVIVK